MLIALVHEVGCDRVHASCSASMRAVILLAPLAMLLAIAITLFREPPINQVARDSMNTALRNESLRAASDDDMDSCQIAAHIRIPFAPFCTELGDFAYWHEATTVLNTRAVRKLCSAKHVSAMRDASPSTLRVNTMLQYALGHLTKGCRVLVLDAADLAVALQNTRLPARVEGISSFAPHPKAQGECEWVVSINVRDMDSLHNLVSLVKRGGIDGIALAVSTVASAPSLRVVRAVMATAGFTSDPCAETVVRYAGVHDGLEKSLMVFRSAQLVTTAL
jgi:hypothetical protein